VQNHCSGGAVAFGRNSHRVAASRGSSWTFRLLAFVAGFSRIEQVNLTSFRRKPANLAKARNSSWGSEGVSQPAPEGGSLNRLHSK
jgi:hypothetical protein